MIYLYSGTPGSGKSFHATKDIWDKVRRRTKNRVIANFPMDFRRDCYNERFSFWENETITIGRLVDYAQQYHQRGLEAQTLLVIDEAQCLFNCRDWQGKDGITHRALSSRPDSRLDWIRFFSQHRKLGYNVILVAQSDKMIDKQIRVLIEYDVKHIKINNGLPLFPLTSFLCVTKWYGQHMKLSTDIICYRRKIASMYDSYAMFDVGGAAAEVKAASALTTTTAVSKQKRVASSLDIGGRASASAPAVTAGGRGVSGAGSEHNDGDHSEVAADEAAADELAAAVVTSGCNVSDVGNGEMPMVPG